MKAEKPRLKSKVIHEPVLRAGTLSPGYPGKSESSRGNPHGRLTAQRDSIHGPLSEFVEVIQFLSNENCYTLSPYNLIKNYVQK